MVAISQCFYIFMYFSQYLHMIIMHIFTYMHYLLVLYVRFERLHLVTSFIYSFSEICHLIPLRM